MLTENMTHKSRTNKLTDDRKTQSFNIANTSHDVPLAAICAEDSRNWISGHDMRKTNTTRKINLKITRVPPGAAEHVVDREMTANLPDALRAVFGIPQIHIEVAGGIVRHDIR